MFIRNEASNVCRIENEALKHNDDKTSIYEDVIVLNIRARLDDEEFVEYLNKLLNMELSNNAKKR